MGTTENARIPPFARYDDTFSGSRLEEDLELLERNSTTRSTTVTTPLLAAEIQSVVPTSPSIAGKQWKARLQMASLCWTMFHMAWCPEPFQLFILRIMADTPSDELVAHAPHLALPYMIGMGYLGPIFAALVNVHLTYRLGFGKVLSLGSALQISAFGLQILDLPLSILAFSSFLTTVGMALQAAHVNSYITSLEHSSSKLSIAHSFHGLGLLATSLFYINFTGVSPLLLYLTSMGVAIINVSLIVFVFGFRSQDECIAEIGDNIMEPETRHRNHYVQILRRKTLHLITVFLLIYLGLEGTINGVMFPYIMTTRSGTSDLLSDLPAGRWHGIVFYAGITLGRVLLLWVSAKLGNRRSVLVYWAVAIMTVCLFWAVPSLVVGAVTMFVVGFVLGPVHPIVMDEVGRILPRWLRAGAIGWIGAVGTTSSRIAPIVVSLLIHFWGMLWFLPLLLFSLVIMVGLWVSIPVDDRTHVD